MADYKKPNNGRNQGNNVSGGSAKGGNVNVNKRPAKHDVFKGGNARGGSVNQSF